MTIIYNKRKNLLKRKLLRKEQTPQEVILWGYLRRNGLGVKFKRQFSVGPYILDFYSPKNKLAIEVDGSHHINNEDYDNERSKYLSILGVKVVRFWNNEINVNIDGVIEKIISELKSIPSSPLQGEERGEVLMPKYIDIHAHINFKAFDEDRNEVIHNALDSDTWVINIGTQYDTSKKAVEMTNEYKEGVYATIGLHPIHTSASYHDKDELGEEGKEFTSRGEIFDKEKYKELAKQGKVVAIGECGLDYYHLNQDSIEKQKKAFIAQIELANELNIPLMLHIRNNPENKLHNAYFDVWELLKKYSKVKGVSHFFAGNVEDMKRFIDIGFYISFAGPITYKPKLEICDYESVVKETPLNMIMADTDSPYVSPIPHRGKRNEPLYVREIVKKIAEIKGLPEKDVAEAIVSNAKRLFDI